MCGFSQRGRARLVRLDGVGDCALSLVVTQVSAAVLLACFSTAYVLVSIEKRRERQLPIVHQV